ncbi:ashwin-like [Nymphalis io]|uniref:ashwin-like n=1 Tax=Inachis io TaxID=171585 RepID=UPI002168B2DA|nr:ashwin-like [Nymphalis io]XP_050348529.1 ashwin-like [Nymphalis io]
MAVPCDMLLHPELLSNEQLIQVIQERHLRINNLQIKARDELLDLFHQFCVPYGQRKYRDSGRGKILNEVRMSNAESAKNLDLINNNYINNRKKTYSNSERLKPPSDLLSGQMKRIKLDCNNIAFNNSNYYKRKMSIDGVSSSIDSPPIKKERKAITWP